MALSSDRLYDYLADEEDARVCKEISDDACKVVPGNFFLILLSQWLTKLGDGLFNAKTVLPWLLTSVGAPAFFSGLLVPIRESGSLLPQLLFGGLLRAYPVRKWFFVLGCVLQGLSVLAIAWVAGRLEGMSAGIAVVLLLIGFSLARGLCSVASKDVMGKTIPKTRRGRLGGYSDSLAGLITLLVAATMILDFELASRLTFLLVLAGLLWGVAALVYARIDEYPGATEGGGNAFKEALASLSILRTDKAFRRFITVRCLMMSSGLAAPYLVILAQQQDMSLAGLGYFIAISGLASFVSGTIWGRLADVSSRRVMIYTAWATAVLCVLAALGVGGGYHLAIWVGLFFLLSVVHQGVRLGRKTYVVDIAQGNRRTDYVAVGNTLIGVMLLVIGVLLSALAQFSMLAVLLLFGASAMLAALLGLKLPEVQ